MIEAEAQWVRGFLAEVTAGTFPDVKEWRSFSETGEVPAEYLKLEGGVERP
ncbi:hypothetical protein [Streptomyces sp. SD15]